MGDLQEQQMPGALRWNWNCTIRISSPSGALKSVSSEIADLLKMHYVFFPSGLRCLSLADPLEHCPIAELPDSGRSPPGGFVHPALGNGCSP